MAYDYIIVGGGSAGCVLANRLSADPSIKVLLLEAGGGDWNPLFRMPAGFAKMTKGVASWGWSTVPQKHLNGRVIWYTQAKVIGGGSSINAQLYTRGNAKDYDAWASDAGATGWSYREVLPYFKRSEDNQRLRQRLSRLWRAARRLLSHQSAADQLRLPARRAGGRHSVQRRFQRRRAGRHRPLSALDPQRRALVGVERLPEARRKAAQNLTVRLNAQTLKIEVENGRAVGVTVAVGTGTETLRADREVIVSCGAIGSPRLLAAFRHRARRRAARRPASPSSTTCPASARNLQDHLDLYAICECTGDHTYDRVAQTAPHGLGGPSVSAVQDRAGHLDAVRDRRLLVRRQAARARPTSSSISASAPASRRASRTMKNPGVTLNSAFLRPRSRGTVRLASADPKAAPLIDPNYWADPYDRECAIKGLRLAREILRQPALKPFVLAERLPGDGLKTDEELARIRLPLVQDRPSPRRAPARWERSPTPSSRPISSCAGSWAAGRRRLGDAVRAVVQHQRADDHGGGEGLRHDPRKAAFAESGDLGDDHAGARPQQRLVVRRHRGPVAEVVGIGLA